MPFNTKRLLPTPRLTSDDYYRFAVVPGREQHQAGIGLGLGQIGTLQSAARLIKTGSNGLVDYSLVFNK